MARLLTTAFLVTVTAGSTTACGGGAQTTVPLQVAGDPLNANVTIDDQPVGSLKMVMAHGVALPAGDHRVSVEAPGYFPFDRIVTAPAGHSDAIHLDVHLEKMPE